ncbi:MAG: response regulator [Pseudomonadales bacterium]
MANILIVDDSILDASRATMLLTRQNHHCTHAISAEQALEILANGIVPDVILMDLVMEGMNGFQAIRIIRKLKRYENVPIVIVSGKGSPTDKIWAGSTGANDYLVKPVIEATLIPCIDKVIQSTPCAGAIE